VTDQKPQTATPNIKVGFIGLGPIGRALTANALKAGFPAAVYDLDDARMRDPALTGGIVMRSSMEVGRWADVIQIAVKDDEQVETALTGNQGILAGARAGAVVAVHSTVREKTMLRLAERAAAAGVGLLDAPVSRSVRGAGTGRFCFMVGGDERWLEVCRLVFAASAGAIVHVGPLGSGATAKLAQQAIFAMNKQSAYEGFQLAARAGLELGKFVEALNASAGQSYAADTWQTWWDKAKAKGGSSEAWGGPDIRSLDLALEHADQCKASLPTLESARALLSGDPAKRDIYKG
jgi:3-hydroxyisobutyrate dehydrogenase-like beta-hydroxyacid dehydrogenase